MSDPQSSVVPQNTSTAAEELLKRTENLISELEKLQAFVQTKQNVKDVVAGRLQKQTSTS